ncbi:MAG: hypothetical protein QM758_24285 [Armatimonas sp.]
MRLRLTMAVVSGLTSLASADFSAVQCARMQVGERQMPPQTMRVYHKDQKTRYDINATLTVILDGDTRQRTIINRATKTYSQESWDPAPEKPTTGPISVKPTERRTSVAGHSTRLYLLNSSMGDISVAGEFWCAEDLDRVPLPSIVGGGFDYTAQNNGMRGHPLRFRLVTTTSEKMQAILTSEIAALSTRELPDSYFDIPKDYVKKSSTKQEAR